MQAQEEGTDHQDEATAGGTSDNAAEPVQVRARFVSANCPGPCFLKLLLQLQDYTFAKQCYFVFAGHICSS